MTVDCIESAGDSADIFDSDDFTNTLYTSLWNGRSVELITEKILKLDLIAQFYIVALQQIDNLVNGQIGCHHYDLLDLTEEIFEEIPLNFEQYVEFAYLFTLYHPLNREFTLADPIRYQADIAQCRNVFKTAVKSAKKYGKKVVKVVKKGAEDAVDFVKDHKKEVLIVAAVAAAAIGVYFVAGALGSAAVGAEATDGTSKRREDEEDPDSTPSSSDIPSSGNPAFVASDLSQQDNAGAISEMTIAPSTRSPENNPVPDLSDHYKNALTGFLEGLRSGKIEPNPEPTFDLFYKGDSAKQESNATTVPSASPSVNTSPDASVPLQSAIASFLEVLQRSRIEQNAQSVFGESNQSITVPSASPPAKTSSDPSVPLQSAIASFLEILQRSRIEQNAQSVFSESNQSATVPSVSAPIYHPAPSPTTALQYAIAGYLESLEHLGSYAADPPQSCYVQTEGTKYHGVRIGFINGMNTSFEAGKSHLYHVKKFAGDMSIEGVYNRRNTLVVDSSEIFLLNYAGFAPVTADLLLENWTQFHEENKDNPDAKYLQFTHSMGTILAEVALQKAPQEIRDRVIVVAMGPAVIIPEGLCYKSFHYASKKDIVHYGENLYKLFLASSNESEREELLKQLIESKRRLILLDSHPDATGIDHDFESPTFDERLKHHIDEYLKQKGKYK